MASTPLGTITGATACCCLPGCDGRGEPAIGDAHPEPADRRRGWLSRVAGRSRWWPESVIRSAIACSPPKYRDGPLARNESIPGSVISTLRYQRGDRGDDALEPSGVAIGIMGDETHMRDSTPAPAGGAARRRCLLAPPPTSGRSPGCHAAPRPVHRRAPARQRPPSSGTTTPPVEELQTASQRSLQLSSSKSSERLFDIQGRPRTITLAGAERERWFGEVVVASRDVWIAPSRAELLAGVQSRVVVDPGDARSGSVFERVTIDGERYFAKTLGYRTDWIMRITGDRDLRTLKIWRAGIMRDVPPEIDHTVVGMAADGEGEDALLTILMRDVAGQLFEEGDATISLEDHLGLVDGLAALSARYWGWSDDIGLTTLEERLRFFALDNIAAEAAVADPPLPMRVAMQGWPRLGERAPGLWELVSAIHAAPARSRRRCVPRPRRSCRATGRWATSVVIGMAARSCSIGRIRGRGRSAGISPGISR